MSGFDPALLERRRRQALKAVLACLVILVLGGPVGAVAERVARAWQLGDPDAWHGFFLLAAALSLLLGPIIVGLWRDFTERHLFDTLLARRPEIGRAGGAAQAALAAEAPEFATLGQGAANDAKAQLLTGRSGGVAFVLAVFHSSGGALASFRLPRPLPGLTVLTRDRGVLGNLLAGASRGVERVALEDPEFERLFEAYGTDQVAARRVLTASMLERLKALDALSGAKGFTCAVCDGRLLLALEGMRWRPPFWRLLQPTARWLGAYERRLEAAIDLPAAVVQALSLDGPALDGPAAAPARPAVMTGGIAPLVRGYEAGFATSIWQVAGTAGVGLAYLASGLLFGGLAAAFGLIGLRQGFAGIGGGPTLLLVSLGLLYGVYAGWLGATQIVTALWRWSTPLALRGTPDAARSVSAAATRPRR